MSLNKFDQGLTKNLSYRLKGYWWCDLEDNKNSYYIHGPNWV